jgi:hypothetical protein
MPSTICRRIHGLEEKWNVKLNLDYHIDAQKMFLRDLDTDIESREGSFVKNHGSYMANIWPTDKGNEKRNRLHGGTTAVKEAQDILKEKRQQEAITMVVASIRPQSLLPSPSRSGKPAPVLRGTLQPSSRPSRRRVSK